MRPAAVDSRNPTPFRWLTSGGEALAAMLAAIAAASQSIRLEMYLFHPSPVADSFRAALLEARRRGVRVQVLLDAFGAMPLPDGYWEEFRVAGGQVRRFNPSGLKRFGVRDHRKVLVCDDNLAIIGGVNIGTEYIGDGVEAGWCDLGLQIRGALAGELAVASDEMFDRAGQKHKPLARLRKSAAQRAVLFAGGEILLTAPGRNSRIKRALTHDLRRARQVAIVCPYFLPPGRLVRRMTRLARRGSKVQLILPGKSDILLSRLAAQSFYHKLLRSGVEIYEYLPQILHAKLFLIDNIVYVGSSNLDSRSLTINYELMLRVSDSKLADEGRKIFARIKSHSRRVELEHWRSSRTIFDRVQARVARWILAHLDPYIAKQSS
jgi:cardiolipin synthase A/B